jgi:hypothetical protein
MRVHQSCLWLLGLALQGAIPLATAADLLSVYREAQTADAVYAAARANYQAGQ